ncbi:hypothetical protein TKK_0007649 [Trichogramma kaykai]
MSSGILDRATNFLRLVWSFACFMGNLWSPFKLEPNYKLKQVCCSLDLLENWERAGLPSRRNEAVGIMRYFAQNELIESKEMGIPDKWYDLDDDFRSWASEQRLRADLTLYDLVAMTAHEALTKTSLTLRHYADMARGRRFDWSSVSPRCARALALNLCEKATRGFYRAWALQSLMAKTDNRLSLVCCELIVDDPSVKNEDLFNMFLAAQPPYEPSQGEKLFGYAINCGVMIFMIMFVHTILSNLQESK